jgi:hypothetical protein
VACSLCREIVLFGSHVISVVGLRMPHLKELERCVGVASGLLLVWGWGRCCAAATQQQETNPMINSVVHDTLTSCGSSP